VPPAGRGQSTTCPVWVVGARPGETHVAVGLVLLAFRLPRVRKQLRTLFVS
jgi:hypothetical protein